MVGACYASEEGGDSDEREGEKERERKRGERERGIRLREINELLTFSFLFFFC